MSSGVPKKTWVIFSITFFIFLVVMFFMRIGREKKTVALVPPIPKPAYAKPKEEVLIEKKISKSLSKSPCAVLSRLMIVKKNNPPVVVKNWVVPCRIKKLTDTEMQIIRLDEKGKEIPGTERVGFRETSDTPGHYTGHWQDGKNKGEFWTDLEYGKGADSDKVVQIVGYENKNGGLFDVRVVIK